MKKIFILVFLSVNLFCVKSYAQDILWKHQGAFEKKELQHLLNRTMFGAAFKDIKHFEGKTMDQVVDELLDVPTSFSEEPIWHAKTNDYPNLIVGEKWINTPNSTAWTISTLQINVELWHHGLILEQKPNIREKMVLFYENFLPSNQGKNQAADGLYYYNRVKLNHEYAVGNYKELIKKLTFEPLMMIYLDLNQSFAYDWRHFYSPNAYPKKPQSMNENYARELQELYTLGKGRYNDQKLFTEDDVKATAAVLSGWFVCNNKDGAILKACCKDSLTYKTTYTPGLHADTDKKFSDFYNSKIIKYKVGQAGGKQEADEMFDMIFDRPEVAENLARKLYRFFVYSYIDDCTEKEVIQPLAKILRDNNYELKPALKALLSSSHFYSKDARGIMIKNPFDFFGGILRMMGAKSIPLSTLISGNLRTYQVTYNNFKSYTRSAGMGLSIAPDVAGYAAYFETPDYHHHWINAESMRNRRRTVFNPNEYTGILTMSQEIDNFTAKNDPLIIFCANQFNFTAASDTKTFVQDNIDYFFAQDLSQAEKDKLVTILEDNSLSWKVAWLSYKGGNKSYYNHVYSKLLRFYDALFSYAEFQLM